MKKIFQLFLISLTTYTLVGCRDIFGDRTQPQSIVQPPYEVTNVVVNEPIQGNIWNPEDTIQIKWIAPTIRKIDLQLYRKTELKLNSAVDLDNSRTYRWIIPLDIALSNHYLIKVINHNDMDVYKFSGRFGIQ